MESPVKRRRESKKERRSIDLNNSEHVIGQLKGKLAIVTTEMKDAVEKMNSMTMEMNKIKEENISYKDRMADLEQENALLVSQIEEMANEQAQRDAIIEEFGIAVEARIVEWKEILDEKDTTIAKLKENLMATDRLTNVSPEERSHAEMERLIQDIDRRDEIIAELQSKLAEAVVEINESSLLIEKFRSDCKAKDGSKRLSKDQRELNKKMADANKRISTLEHLLERVEKDAKVKSEQLCEALAILNKYEDENTSLAEAFQEIRVLKDQVLKKNQHIEEFVNIVNKLEEENTQLEEAIVILRNKSSTGEDEDLSLGELVLNRHKAQEEQIMKMQRDFDELSSENVGLKFQIRKLKTALKETLKNQLKRSNGTSSDGENQDQLSQRSESKKEHVELLRIKENVKSIIEENEALRQGMHEILDCIHNQEGQSIVTIQSETLENLLQALDARHLAGWYHPAMRLQGRVNYLQGSNAELRAQLQQIRKNQIMLQAQIQDRSDSVEEGECSQPRSTSPPVEMSSPHRKDAMHDSPKSARSSHSQNADSGRASGKATELEEMQQADDDVAAYYGGNDTPMADDAESLGKRSEEIYAMAKEMVAQESDFRRALNDAEKKQKILEARIAELRGNLSSCVSLEEHERLKQQCLDANLRLRSALEAKYAEQSDELRGKAMSELRNELVVLHSRLAQLSPKFRKNPSEDDGYSDDIMELKAENERLKKAAEIAHEEALVHREIDSTVLAEFNDLRKRIAKFEVGDGEALRETARLSLEVANRKVVEVELREKISLLERKVMEMQETMDRKRESDSDGEIAEQRQTTFSSNENQIEVIEFLQQQYAGSTSLSSWERFEAAMNKLNSDRKEVKELLGQISDRNNNLEVQRETLSTRLRIVEQLKDILEQQIGKKDVEDTMLKFNEASRNIIDESMYKLQISQLTKELQKTNVDLSNHEAKLELMEKEMISVQKAWQVRKSEAIRRLSAVDVATETVEKETEKIMEKQFAVKATQVELKLRSIECQCDIKESQRVVVESDDETGNGVQNKKDDTSATVPNVAILQEQLGQALALASKRALAVAKCEPGLAEYQTLVDLIEEKLTAKSSNVVPAAEPAKSSEDIAQITSANEALLSTVRSLEKLLICKDETIERYQALLKEDREKHNEAVERYQEEIQSLKKMYSDRKVPEIKLDDLDEESEYPERDIPIGETARSNRSEEILSLKEKLHRLESELNVSNEVAERWHQLAEDRLKHLDSTRQRLEQQHKEEMDSYRKELIKRQHEVNELRYQMSEVRRSAKSEIQSFMKALKIEDNKLAEEIENDLEDHVTVASQKFSTTYTVDDSRRSDYDSTQTHIENLRKQLQAHIEKEKSYKNEITELQQQLSRRYMAIKTQEKKASKRELQLERKVKELEEELYEAKELLDRHFIAMQAKRAKTAEDLGLWEKLKNWQKAAERLKEKLREKTEECQKLQQNHDKLRNLIACMEREKWFLRGKFIRGESAVNVPVWPSSGAPSPLEQQHHHNNNNNNDALVEELQRECQELRERIKELVGRLSRQDSEKSDEIKRFASVAYEDNDFIKTELKTLIETQEILEKENLKLETDNFELRLELERAHVNMPRYEEKIQHLEKYIELMKSEKAASAELSTPKTTCYIPTMTSTTTTLTSTQNRREGTQRTKSELERTVLTLKSLVEKLQQENKRLRSNLLHSDMETRPCDCYYLRAELEKASQKIVDLETDLEMTEKRLALMESLALEKCDEGASGQVALLRQQLDSKSQLLLKVKDLLAKAVANEKALRHQIQQLEFKQTLSIIPEYGSSLSHA
ncbi:hypothetical protein TKK_0001202 [Trichogramma kaykai]|uniref:Centrosomal protein of 290kDa coiled-coil region domain-containing protein n=1 Tax=Trichogramma kaykai TaxID=54128 RepID=A0ABD2WXH9_9HYME